MAIGASVFVDAKLDYIISCFSVENWYDTGQLRRDHLKLQVTTYPRLILTCSIRFLLVFSQKGFLENFITRSGHSRAWLAKANQTPRQKTVFPRRFALFARSCKPLPPADRNILMVQAK